jgi:hypothetical protein
MDNDGWQAISSEHHFKICISMSHRAGEPSSSQAGLDDVRPSACRVTRPDERRKPSSRKRDPDSRDLVNARWPDRREAEPSTQKKSKLRFARIAANRASAPAGQLLSLFSLGSFTPGRHTAGLSRPKPVQPADGTGVRKARRFSNVGVTTSNWADDRAE